MRASVGAGRVRASIPRSTRLRTVPPVLALAMREVNLAVVVPNEFAVGLLHLGKPGSLVEVKIRKTPYDANYVELNCSIQNSLVVSQTCKSQH